MQIYICSRGGSASCRAAGASAARALASPWQLPETAGTLRWKEVKGLSSVERRKKKKTQICSLPRQQLRRLMSSRRRGLRGTGGGTGGYGVVSDPARMPPREPWPRKFPPADWRAVLSVCVRACEVLGLFWEIPGQSADSSRLAFVSFTSESSPQVVAYFGVAMATAHGNPSVVEKKGRKKKSNKI